MEGETEMSPTLRHYIEDKVGFDRTHEFEVWAFGKTQMVKIRTDPRIVLEWNFLHKKRQLNPKLSVWDSIDRMIEIWNERMK